MKMIYSNIFSIILIYECCQNGNLPVVMIAHSMGCTMSLYFLNQQTKAWKDKYIKSLITLAGPWGGSAYALEIFTSGTNFAEAKDNINLHKYWFLQHENIKNDPNLNLELGKYDNVNAAVKIIERTQPSLAWMMPSQDIWKEQVLIQTDSNSVDYKAANLGDYFKLLDVPNMAEMYEDTQKLTSGLPDPGVEVCHG